MPAKIVVELDLESVDMGIQPGTQGVDLFPKIEHVCDLYCCTEADRGPGLRFHGPNLAVVNDRNQ